VVQILCGIDSCGSVGALDAFVGLSNGTTVSVMIFLQYKMTAEAKMVGEVWPTAQAVDG
jgi:hypothetical protein